MTETGMGGGQRVVGGRYRIDALLGRGGMSEVYVGHDERLDRPVAVKVLRQAPLDGRAEGPEALELLDAQDRDRLRFLREIRMAARLEHPGTPAVYDTGVDEDRDGTRIWLVMQLLRGRTLEGLLDEADFEHAPPPVTWAAALAAQIAAVLADVHRVDIVHRDIKPANIMVVDGGLVKVLDFGIAILRGAGSLPRLTQVDRTVGTPTYMSPEQHLGRPVTAASDVYSLGCLLFELLTGDPPYLATESVPLRAHHLQSPVPSVRAARSDVPTDLDALVAAMMAKEPERRPSATDVYAALVPHLHAAPGEPSGDPRDPTRPFHLPLLAQRPERDADGVSKPLDQRDFEDAVEHASQLLEEGEAPAAVRLLQDAHERATGDPLHRLELTRMLGLALYLTGESRRAAGLLAEAGRRYRSSLAASHPRVLECAYHAGHAYAEVGEGAAALAQLRFFVQNAPTNGDDAAEQHVESRFVIAQLLGADGRLEEALAELRAIVPLLQHLHGDESIQLRNVLRQIERLEKP
ncbi:MAG: protein kinase [Kineosporiaceae bacterium]